MKKLIALIIVVVIAYAGWYLWTNSGTQTEEVEVSPSTTRPDAKNATFEFEDGPVALENGKSSVPLVAGSAISTETVLNEDNTEYADINADKKNDAVVIISQNSGGSGVFVYIAAYVSGNVQYKGSNAVFVGDRISPQEIEISPSGVITLTYLDRAPGEAMASAPTVSTKKQYVYRSGTLEER